MAIRLLKSLATLRLRFSYLKIRQEDCGVLFSLPRHTNQRIHNVWIVFEKQFSHRQIFQSLFQYSESARVHVHICWQRVHTGRKSVREVRSGYHIHDYIRVLKSQHLPETHLGVDFGLLRKFAAQKDVHYDLMELQSHGSFYVMLAQQGDLQQLQVQRKLCPDPLRCTFVLRLHNKLPKRLHNRTLVIQLEEGVLAELTFLGFIDFMAAGKKIIQNFCAYEFDVSGVPVQRVHFLVYAFGIIPHHTDTVDGDFVHILVEHVVEILCLALDDLPDVRGHFGLGPCSFQSVERETSLSEISPI